eukprot:7981504-Pyramimonas_sp.AAC.2
MMRPAAGPQPAAARPLGLVRASSLGACLRSSLWTNCRGADVEGLRALILDIRLPFVRLATCAV